ncbi:hypothetical protein [Pseudanabaena sp. FACHB-2040]|uniref:hypothetical protein n=1 Tax=Pseudanabaena sp. FACHB-2040 TaxID=2692859 RepID=UPI001689902D|nr:hypothetical protein [Pseudanabaena sp. FACHB-2040]MBD2260987.1 hypothetical protein [Pseudanabaena sp. FACHB-2040]
MFRQSVLNSWLLALSLTSLALPVSAHKVQVSGDVGGTLHIEPNDVARAGEPTEVWFALTRQGGQVIPLADCDCQLSVFAQPYGEGATPLAQPPLAPVTAESYENIPGAEVVFPDVGAYTLVLTGSSRAAEEFQPFELPFEVTVAARSAAAPAASAPTAGETEAAPASTEVLGVESGALPPAAAPLWQPSVIAATIVLLAGLVWSLRHRRKDDDIDPRSKP